MPRQPSHGALLCDHEDPRRAAARRSITTIRSSTYGCRKKFDAGHAETSGRVAVHINRVLLTAILTADPELHTQPDGSTICTLRVTFTAPESVRPARISQRGAITITVADPSAIAGVRTVA